MTIESPETINTTEVQDGQAAGSIVPLRIRKIVDSLAGVYSLAAKTADYTVTLADRGTCLEMNSASAHTFFIPTNASVAFDLGTVIEFCQVGAGQVSITATTPGTTTIRNTSSATTRVQWSHVSVRKRATDEWVLSGDLT